MSEWVVPMNEIPAEDISYPLHDLSRRHTYDEKGKVK